MAATLEKPMDKIVPGHVESIDEDGPKVLPNITEIGTFRVLGLNPDDADFFTNYPEEKRKRVFRKVRRLSEQDQP